MKDDPFEELHDSLIEFRDALADTTPIRQALAWAKRHVRATNCIVIVAALVVSAAMILPVVLGCQRSGPTERFYFVSTWVTEWGDTLDRMQEVTVTEFYRQAGGIVAVSWRLATPLIRDAFEPRGSEEPEPGRCTMPD